MSRDAPVGVAEAAFRGLRASPLIVSAKRVEVTIASRFNGPPDSGHGGYVSGLVAGLVGGPARVRLHRPPPLGRRLLARRDGEGVTVFDGDAVVATGAADRVELAVPAPVAFAEAELAARGYPGFRDHAFSRCFGCGPDRAPGDGLRIFPGPVAGRDVVAAPWIPDASLGDGGTVRPEFLAPPSTARVDGRPSWRAVGRPCFSAR